MNAMIINIKGAENLNFQGLGFSPEVVVKKLGEIFDDFELLEVDAYSNRIAWATKQLSVSDRDYSDKFLNNIISECKSYLPAKSFRVLIADGEYLEGTVWLMSISFKSKNIAIPEHIVSKIRSFTESYSIDIQEL